MIPVIVGVTTIVVIMILILYFLRRHYRRKSEKFTVTYGTKNGIVEVPDANFGKEKSEKQ